MKFWFFVKKVKLGILTLKFLLHLSIEMNSLAQQQNSLIYYEFFLKMQLIGIELSKEELRLIFMTQLKLPANVCVFLRVKSIEKNSYDGNIWARVASIAHDVMFHGHIHSVDSTRLH